MSSLIDRNGVFFCNLEGRCGRCGGALGELEAQENSRTHVSFWDCIYVLQNTLNRHEENAEMQEDVIGKLVNRVAELDKLLEETTLSLTQSEYAAEAIQQCLDAERASHHWYSANVEPEVKDIFYLCRIKDATAYINSRFYDRVKGWHPRNTTEIVTHWMPLPEPPEVE